MKSGIILRIILDPNWEAASRGRTQSNFSFETVILRAVFSPGSKGSMGGHVVLMTVEGSLTGGSSPASSGQVLDCSGSRTNSICRHNGDWVWAMGFILDS